MELTIMLLISILIASQKQSLNLPGVAGGHDLVPGEILLPPPSAWAILWQETCVPVSE